MRIHGRVGVLLLCGTLVGCAALADDMRRAEGSYEEARYEDTLRWLEALESDAPRMDVNMRARYFYLRGMAEYRVGHRADALHYLAVAREVAGDDGAGLRPEWRQIMDRTLTELTPTTMTHLPPDPESAEQEDVEPTSGGEAVESDDEEPPAA